MEKGYSKKWRHKVYIAKYKMPDGSVGQTEEYTTPGMAAANVKKGAEFYRVESKLSTPAAKPEVIAPK
jgi:hypothetical protein